MNPPADSVRQGALIAFLSLTALIAVGVAGVGFRTHRLYQDLFSHGASASATVTATEARPGLRGGRVRYSF